MEWSAHLPLEGGGGVSHALRRLPELMTFLSMFGHPDPATTSTSFLEK